MSKQFSTEGFIKKSKEVHGNKYDYSKVNYIKSNLEVVIICPIHGEFKQTPNAHLAGKGCRKCSIEHRVSLELQEHSEKFIRKAKEVHGDKYDYSKVNYKGAKTPVDIICPIHGVFSQHPHRHLSGNGCPKCGIKANSDNRIEKSSKEFIQKASLVHGDKYDYSKVDYKGNDKEVIIICPIHGEFKQTPSNHLYGYGCPKCGYETNSQKRRETFSKEFLNKAIKIHGNKYDYSLVNYSRAIDPVNIICPIHGVFSQSPHDHLQGKGCPKCFESKGETEVRVLLENSNIEFNQYESFPLNKTMSFDFYLQNFNIFIEVQGQQHFKWVPIFQKTKEDLENQISRDIDKYRWAEREEIPLLYYIPNEYPEDLFTDLYFQGIYKPYNTFFTIEDLEKRLLDIKQ